MPNQDSMVFINIIVLSKRQNKRAQKLKLLWLIGVYFNSKEKKIYFQGLNICNVLIS